MDAAVMAAWAAQADVRVRYDKKYSDGDTHDGSNGADNDVRNSDDGKDDKDGDSKRVHDHIPDVDAVAWGDVAVLYEVLVAWADWAAPEPRRIN